MSTAASAPTRPTSSAATGCDVCVVGSALFQRGRDTAREVEAVKRRGRSAARDWDAPGRLAVRLLLQRVTRAQVRSTAESSGRSALACWSWSVSGHDDTEEDAGAMADKAVDLRIFRDEEGKTNRSLIDVGGEVLAISQFTLFADTRKGRRPSFLDAAPPELGERLYERFCAAVEARGVKVAQRDIRRRDGGRARQRRPDDHLARPAAS